MKTFIYLITVQFLVRSVITQQGTYKAAVVEYNPRLTADTPADRILENVREYTIFVEEAAEKDVQIIVFPESGLTGYTDINEHNLEELSTEVPDPIHKISPCFGSNSNYSKAFIDLSCSANAHKIYLVVNLIEKQFDLRLNKKIYHNTNVAFDRGGAVIARYRKINLYNEDMYVPGNTISTFKSDFGVTFGMFICADILFKQPALDILSNSSVTDIIFSAAWFSELPFFEGLSVQHGYAKSNGINLLAASYNDPSLKNGGSGIYLGNGRIGEVYISSAKTSRMTIQDVPRLNTRNPSGTCQLQNSNEGTERGFGLGIGGGVLPDISSFKTAQEDMSNYTFKSLDLDKQIFSETICSQESKYCCSFNITVTKNPNVQPNYIYKLVAFFGSRQRSLSTTMAVRNCGVVACLNESNTSCGERNTLPPTGITFENLEIKGIFNSFDSHDQPATLKYDLKPINEYIFCKRTLDNQVEITMAITDKQSSVLTFGIHGRVFNYDNKPTGPINSASLIYLNINAIFVVSAIIFLFQD